MKKDISTEEKILKAAGLIFRSKGYAGARMQEIADSAGINKAMLHYYFRSKKMLFDKIFKEILGSFHQNIVKILNDDINWEKKIIALTERFFLFVSKNKDIPIFIFNELHKNPEFFQKQLLRFETIRNSSFFKELKAEMDKGNIVKTDPLQVLIHIFSGMIFPAVAEPIISSIGDFKGNDFNDFMSQRKEIVPKMIIEYLKKA